MLQISLLIGQRGRMIHVQAQQYQVVLWENVDRLSGGPALRLDFDTLESAEAALQAHRQDGKYVSGVILEWHKHSGIWDLVDQYP
jgi:hypothetical protein